jgi:hypothetical protein
MITSYHFGHKIYSELIPVDDKKLVGSPWRYVDTEELVDESPKRKCPKCEKNTTLDGHDPCIANLPNVQFACCGHGIQGDAYIKFENVDVYRFSSTEDLYEFIEKYEIRKYGILRLPDRQK